MGKRKYGKRMKSAKTVSFVIEETHYQTLKETAKEQGVTMGEKLRLLIVPWLSEVSRLKTKQERAMYPLRPMPAEAPVPTARRR